MGFVQEVDALATGKKARKDRGHAYAGPVCACSWAGLRHKEQTRTDWTPGDVPMATSVLPSPPGLSLSAPLDLLHLSPPSSLFGQPLGLLLSLPVDLLLAPAGSLLWRPPASALTATGSAALASHTPRTNTTHSNTSLRLQCPRFLGILSRQALGQSKIHQHKISLPIRLTE